MTTGRINQGSRYYNNRAPRPGAVGACARANKHDTTHDPAAPGPVTRASERRPARAGRADAVGGRATATARVSARDRPRFVWYECTRRVRVDTRGPAARWAASRPALRTRRGVARVDEGAVDCGTGGGDGGGGGQAANRATTTAGRNRALARSVTAPSRDRGGSRDETRSPSSRGFAPATAGRGDDGRPRRECSGVESSYVAKR